MSIRELFELAALHEVTVTITADKKFYTILLQKGEVKTATKLDRKYEIRQAEVIGKVDDMLDYNVDRTFRRFEEFAKEFK